MAFSNLEICASRYIKAVLINRARMHEDDAAKADSLLVELLSLFNVSDEEFEALGRVVEHHLSQSSPPEHLQAPSVDP